MPNPGMPIGQIQQTKTVTPHDFPGEQLVSPAVLNPVPPRQRFFNLARGPFSACFLRQRDNPQLQQSLGLRNFPFSPWPQSSFVGLFFLMLASLLVTGCEPASNNAPLASETGRGSQTAAATSQPQNPATTRPAATAGQANSSADKAATTAQIAASNTGLDATTGAESPADANNNALLNQVFKDFRGAEYTINNLRGKVVLIVYWATWCGPCKREIPALNELYDRYRHKDVVFLAVSQDDERATVEDFLRTDQVGKTIQYPIVHGIPYTKIFGRMNAIPTLLLLDKQGNTVGKHEGTAPAAVIAQAIEKYL